MYKTAISEREKKTREVRHETVKVIQFISGLPNYPLEMNSFFFCYHMYEPFVPVQRIFGGGVWEEDVECKS